jgi:hypothetical protein
MVARDHQPSAQFGLSFKALLYKVSASSSRFAVRAASASDAILAKLLAAAGLASAPKLPAKMITSNAAAHCVFLIR